MRDHGVALLLSVLVAGCSSTSSPTPDAARRDGGARELGWGDIGVLPDAARVDRGADRGADRAAQDRAIADSKTPDKLIGGDGASLITELRLVLRLRRQGGGSNTKAQAYPLLRLNGVSHRGALIPAITTNETNYVTTFAKNPATQAGWTVTEVNGLQAGLEIAMDGGDTRLTALFVEVVYAGKAPSPLRPNANGATNTFSIVEPSSALHFQVVDDAPATPDDNDYLQGTSVGETELFELENL